MILMGIGYLISFAIAGVLAFIRIILRHYPKKSELTWNICISDRDPGPPATINTRMLLYISIGSLLVNAVGSCINEAGKRSIIFCRKQN